MIIDSKFNNNMNNYKIIIDNNLCKDINNYINFNCKTLVITDDLIPSMYYENILKNNNTYLYVIKHGEESKNIDNFIKINEYLLENEFDRFDQIIGVGGGVVTDLSGFIASTYKRGIKLILIPTSLLAMVDSSIGGKNGINFDLYKNSIGSFYNPSLVLVDSKCLDTLDDRNYINGLMEVIKMSSCFDKDLFNIIKNNNINTIRNYNFEIITKSIQIKNNVVNCDPFDNNERKVLNFGHTIGHALEIMNNNLLHGEAVGLGMYLMTTSDELKNLILKYINIFNLKKDLCLDKNEILSKIKNDKKCELGLINVIYLFDLCKYEIKKVNYEWIEGVLSEINNWK